MSIQEMQERREYLLRAWACGMIDRQDARRGISVLTAEIEKAALRAQKKPRVYSYTTDATKRATGPPAG